MRLILDISDNALSEVIRSELSAQIARIVDEKINRVTESVLSIKMGRLNIDKLLESALEKSVGSRIDALVSETFGDTVSRRRAILHNLIEEKLISILWKAAQQLK
jgi:RNA-binding protein YlmH